MARWGKVDYSQLKRLQNKIEKFQKIDSDVLCRQIANELAQRLLKRVIELTPTKTGELRRSWTINEVIQIGNNEYQIEVTNSMEYASYVEYGHRQRPGRFIPGHWNGNQFIYQKGAKEGMVLSVSWVKGRYMLTKSTAQIENIAPSLIEKRVMNELIKIFEND